MDVAAAAEPVVPVALEVVVLAAVELTHETLVGWKVDERITSEHWKSMPSPPLNSTLCRGDLGQRPRQSAEEGDDELDRGDGAVADAGNIERRDVNVEAELHHPESATSPPPILADSHAPRPRR